MQRQPLVCVVDPNAADYATWSKIAERGDCELHIVTSATEALRLARTRVVDLWVVNTELPGLSGYELCSILRTSNSKAPVYLVADQYAPETEQAAWRARVTLFGVKGGHANWLHDWLESRSSQAPLRVASPAHAVVETFR